MNLQSNIDFLNDLMQFSPKGPLVQVFIINAVHTAAKQVAEEPDPRVFDSAVFDGKVWQDVAKDILRRMDDKFGRLQPDVVLPD
ncbi:hypothetical protein AVME950_00395 [Acidovorax sp. SUPP950]|uniref:hypothetical protein n=1 Tax=Acidovorax sp. SUPP950 TaxID=511901 RepID=UPI0023BDD397|nr:hypothetical protein [Acidovorax sp. SUPP950]GKS73297.1 hypothetical protein AVME950_00395 [Acidovorax sp. SUPP950]